MSDITRNTLWKESGDTTIPGLREEFARMPGSPLAAHAEAIWHVATPYTRLLAGMSWVEKKHETWPHTPIPVDFHNFLSITAGWDSTINAHAWRRFDSYAACAAFWKGLLESPTGPYRNARTISDLIYIYAPPSDGQVGGQSQTEPYIARIVEIMNRLANPIPLSPEFVPFGEVREFHVLPNAVATPRKHATRASALVHEAFVGPGGEIAGDGFFVGETVEGNSHWLRTVPEALAVHASALVEPL